VSTSPTQTDGNMALSNRQLEVLRRLAKRPFGCMTRFEFLDEIGDSSARRLLKEGFAIGTREQGGMIKITQVGLDAISDRPRRRGAAPSRSAKVAKVTP
jgi:hypothetical protein